MTFIVTYRLNNDPCGGGSFRTRLASLGENRILFPGVSVLRTNDQEHAYSADELASVLTSGLSQRPDCLLIYCINDRRPNGLLSADDWNWLNARIHG